MKTLFLTCGIIFTIFAALTFAQPLIDSTYSEPELIEQTATNILSGTKARFGCIQK